jgi:uncharacterized protein with PIN domain
MKPKTKESFEQFLATVKKQAEGITLPQSFNSCPFCDNAIVLLKIENMTHAVPPYIWEGQWYVYRCESCGEGFTTSKSDTLSLATLKLKIK